jgi:hypothetical protein
MFYIDQKSESDHVISMSTILETNLEISLLITITLDATVSIND